MPRILSGEKASDNLSIARVVTYPIQVLIDDSDRDLPRIVKILTQDPGKRFNTIRDLLIIEARKGDQYLVLRRSVRLADGIGPILLSLLQNRLQSLGIPMERPLNPDEARIFKGKDGPRNQLIDPAGNIIGDEVLKALQPQIQSAIHETRAALGTATGTKVDESSVDANVLNGLVDRFIETNGISPAHRGTILVIAQGIVSDLLRVVSPEPPNPSPVEVRHEIVIRTGHFRFTDDQKDQSEGVFLGFNSALIAGKVGEWFRSLCSENGLNVELNEKLKETEQVLMELAKNSFDYGHGGDIELIFNENEIMGIVRDEGAGFRNHPQDEITARRDYEHGLEHSARLSDSFTIETNGKKYVKTIKSRMMRWVFQKIPGKSDVINGTKITFVIHLL